jgi:hypothetical protein
MLELKQKSLENKQMKEKLKEQLLENEHLRKEQQLNKIIVNNIINLIQLLSFNSSYRKLYSFGLPKIWQCKKQWIVTKYLKNLSKIIGRKDFRNCSKKICY